MALDNLTGKKEAKGIKQEINEIKEKAAALGIRMRTAGPLVKHQLEKVLTEDDKRSVTILDLL